MNTSLCFRGVSAGQSVRVESGSWVLDVQFLGTACRVADVSVDFFSGLFKIYSMWRRIYRWIWIELFILRRCVNWSICTYRKWGMSPRPFISSGSLQWFPQLPVRFIAKLTLEVLLMPENGKDRSCTCKPHHFLVLYETNETESSLTVEEQWHPLWWVRDLLELELGNDQPQFRTNFATFCEAFEVLQYHAPKLPMMMKEYW